MATDAKAKKKSARHASALKRARQSERKRVRNVSTKSAVKSFEKKVMTAIQSGKADDAKKALQVFMSTIDRAAQKGVIHVKRASRRISRLSKQISQMTSK